MNLLITNGDDVLPDFQTLAQQFKLLGDPTRLRILAMIQHQEHCVCDVVDALEMTQPNISQHIRKLKDAGWVREQKRGQWVYYSLVDPLPDAVQSALQFLPSPKSSQSNCEEACECNDV